MAAGVNKVLETDNPSHLSGKDIFFYRAYKTDDTPLSDNKLTVDSGTAIYRICTARNTKSGDVHDNELVVTGVDFKINSGDTIQKKINHIVSNLSTNKLKYIYRMISLYVSLHK